MKDKIILATANSKKEIYSATAEEFSAIAPNIPIGLLHAYIKSKNIDIEMIDSEADGILIDELINLIEKKDPLLLGLICSGANPSSSTMTMVGIIDFFQKFKKRNSEIKTFLWGPHPTVLPQRTLMETGVDFVVRGEGYETIVELFNALRSKKSAVEKIAGLSYLDKAGGKTIYIENKNVPLVKNLDTLPNIDWAAMKPSKYRAHNWHCLGDLNNRTPYAIIWTSFGCPYPCTFCCVNNLFGRRTQRFRSIDSVINEISILAEKHDVKHLKILDELFVINPKRIEEFCDKLAARNYGLNMWSFARVDTVNRRLLKKLKKAGMNWISYGFESATPEMLKSVNKGIRSRYSVDDVIKMTQDEGIYICADIIFGLPEDNIDTMRLAYDFLVKHKFEWINIYPLFAYPGTELYKTIEEPKSWKTYMLYGYECEPQSTKYLSSKEVLKFRDEAFTKYFARAKYLDMIEDKFNLAARQHIEKMFDIKLKRKILGD